MNEICQITSPQIAHGPFAHGGDYERLSLRRYALWWLKHRPIIPPVDGIRHVGKYAGLVMYREGPFQTQLFIAAPGHVVTRHCHRNVESMEMLVCGKIEFSTEKMEFESGMLKIGPNESHWAPQADSAGSFFSFQKWLNGIRPTSVDLDWNGTPIDENHERDILTT